MVQWSCTKPARLDLPALLMIGPLERAAPGKDKLFDGAFEPLCTW
jgi:hypothetical protein